MKYFMIPLLTFLTFSVYAEKITSKVDSIDVATRKGVPHLIKLENGRVVFVKWSKVSLVNSFRSSWEHGDLLKVEVDKDSNFISAETIDEGRTLRTYEEGVPGVRKSFSDSEVSSAMAATIFQRMRRNYQGNSQCYNRAHIWAYEEYRRSGTKTKKYFLFFTNRYIRNYRYKWWFHVSPAVSVTNMGNQILDRRYTGGPRNVDTWTSNFIYSRRNCPIVNTYNAYYNNQEKEDCYVIPVSMYFWQPRDIVRRDATGAEKTSFIKSEVDYAYWEAF